MWVDRGLPGKELTVGWVQEICVPFYSGIVVPDTLVGLPSLASHRAAACSGVCGGE